MALTWIDRFTLKIIARPPLGFLASFEMTSDEQEAAERLKERGLVSRRLGFWRATPAGRNALAEL